MRASRKPTLSLQWLFSYSITSTYTSIRNVSAREGSTLTPTRLAAELVFPATSACLSERSLPQLRHFLSLFCRAGICNSRRFESKACIQLGVISKRFPNLGKAGQPRELLSHMKKTFIIQIKNCRQVRIYSFELYTSLSVSVHKNKDVNIQTTANPSSIRTKQG